MPLPCYRCVLVFLVSCNVAPFGGVIAGPAASQLDDDEATRVTVLSDKEKLAKLHGEGLNDVEDFMDSFGQGQLATDDVKCDLCKHLLFDLNAGVSNLRADGVAEVCSTPFRAVAQSASTFACEAYVTESRR